MIVWVRASHAAFRSGQFGPIEAELITRLLDDATIDDLAGTTQGDLRRAAFAMNRDRNWSLPALMVLVRIEATATFGQPFSKCCALHRRTPLS